MDGTKRFGMAGACLIALGSCGLGPTGTPRASAAALPYTVLSAENTPSAPRPPAPVAAPVAPPSSQPRRPAWPAAAARRATVRLANPEGEPAPPPRPVPAPAGGNGPPAAPGQEPAPPAPPKALPIDLPTALRLVNASNPTIALARERVQEAYARLLQAQSLMLPTLVTGPTWQHHDGLIQNARGEVFFSSKSSLFEGGGAQLIVQTGDALFGPLVARRLVDAVAAASRAVTDDIQLEVALAYLDLLRVYGALAINTETLNKVRLMVRAAESALRNQKSKNGAADLNRAMTEYHLRQEERIDLLGQLGEVSARLTQLLLLQPTVDLKPTDRAILPITLVPVDPHQLDDLVAVGLMNRPELAESRALVDAALARWRQAKWSPLLPQLQATYWAGTFAAGFQDSLDHHNQRDDALAQAVWQLPGLGVGYVANVRVGRSQYNQASIHVTEVSARVAAEVTAAAKLALTRRLALEDAQQAVRQAELMWERLYKASFGLVTPRGQFDPLEPLIAEQQLAQARQLYLTQVIEYDKAQFRLYRALGQPPEAALPKSEAIPTPVPVLPRRTRTTPDNRPAGGGQPRR